MSAKELAKVIATIALVGGPNPDTIVPDAELEFCGIYHQNFITLRSRIAKVSTAGTSPPDDPRTALRWLFGGDGGKGDVRFEGCMITMTQSNAGSLNPSWVSVSSAKIRGLWRRSHSRIAHLLPEGNGFLEILE